MPRFSPFIRGVAISLIAMFVHTGQSQAGSDTFETFGDIVSYGIPAAAAIISVSKNDYEGVWQLGLTYGASWGATELLKETIESTRPNGKSESFPSGHTSRAFAGASYLHYRYGLKYGLPAYALAFAVGYSRVESDNHHWRDVMGGAVIANVAAFLLTDRYESPVIVNAVIDSKEGIFAVTASLRF